MGGSLGISAPELREKYPLSHLCTPPPAVLSQTRRTKAVQSLGEGASQASQPSRLWAVSEGRGSTRSYLHRGPAQTSRAGGDFMCTGRRVLCVLSDRNSPLCRHISQNIELKGLSGKASGRWWGGRR